MPVRGNPIRKFHEIGHRELLGAPGEEGMFGTAEHPFFTRRAEQLSVADFVELTNWVAAHRQ